MFWWVGLRKIYVGSLTCKLKKFVSKSQADIEDLFDPKFYLKLVSLSFNKGILIKDLKGDDQILKQIERYWKVERFNHYKSAAYLLTHPELQDEISEDTKKRFKHLFIEINKLLV